MIPRACNVPGSNYHRKRSTEFLLTTITLYFEQYANPWLTSPPRTAMRVIPVTPVPPCDAPGISRFLHHEGHPCTVYQTVRRPRYERRVQVLHLQTSRINRRIPNPEGLATRDNPAPSLPFPSLGKRKRRVGEDDHRLRQRQTSTQCSAADTKSRTSWQTELTQL